MKPDAPYDLEAHRHRFAVWAAARAAQRRLRANVATLRQALEECGVCGYLRDANPNDIDQSRFDALHRLWCTKIIDGLRKAGLSDVSFGRAAKLLAVYLKSAVVLGPHSRTALAHVAHPPIDSILLKAIACRWVDSEHARGWSKIKWTQLNEAEYYTLVGQLRNVLGPEVPFWTLERDWNVTANADSE